jgi:hypothetical protein
MPSKAQRVSQGRINLAHGQTPNDPVNSYFGDRRQVVGHYDGVGEKAGPSSFGRRTLHHDPAGMVCPSDPAADHGDDDLGQSALKLIGLDH